MLDVIPSEDVARLLEKGKAQVLIKRTGNKDQLGLYVEGELLYRTKNLHTYTLCAEALIVYMNSY